MANKIRILTNGQTVVYALTKQAGGTPTVYAADGTTPAAASGSTATDLILVAPTLDYYTLSLKIDGTECSSRFGSGSPVSFRVDGEHDHTFTPGLNNAQLAAAEQADSGVFAPLASPALTGAPTAPTQAAGNSSTRIATTAYADAAVSVQHTADNGTYQPILPTAGGFTYDASGNILTDPDGNTYTWNADGTLHTQVKGGVTRTYAWNADGTLASVA